MSYFTSRAATKLYGTSRGDEERQSEEQNFTVSDACSKFSRLARLLEERRYGIFNFTDEKLN